MLEKDWEELAIRAARGIDGGDDSDDWDVAARQGLSGLSSWQPPPPPVERNIVGETAAALGRGVGRAIEYTGRGIEELGGESVGGVLRSAGQSVQQQEILAPSEELKTGQAGMLRRTLAGAAESIPMSVVPLATGAAGAAVGGPIGALAGGAAGLGTLFYGGTYSAEKERALKEFEQLHPDWTPEQREQEASSFAHKQALWETGTEGVSDLVLMGIGKSIAKGMAREGIDGGRAVLRDLIGSGGPKQMAKKFAQVYAAEGGTEIAAYLGQAANEQTYGLGEGPTLTGTLDTALVSLWMTGAMGGAMGGLNYAARNKIVSDLNSENKLIRDRAAEKVEAKVAEKFGPESANQWRSHFESSVAEGRGGGFNIDSPLFGATAEAYAPEGGGALDKALAATQPTAARPADTDAQLQAASRAAEEAAMEARPDYEAASALASEAASEANAEAQFETESVAARKRAAGMPLNAEEQAALAAAEQRLARPAVAAPAPVVPRQDMQLPTQQAGTEARQAGAEAVETPEQAQQGYETYQPEPPVNPASEYGRQQAEFERIQKEAAEYNRLKNIPDKFPELPSALRSIDSLSRPQLLDVAKIYGIKTVNDKTGKSIGVKAAVKRFADSMQKRIAAETRLRTPEEQARLDQLAGRTPERMAEAARKAREARQKVEYQQAAAELENAPLKLAPGAEMRLIRDIEQARPNRAAAIQRLVRQPSRSAIESAISFELGEPTAQQVAAETAVAQKTLAAEMAAKRAAVEQELANVFTEEGLANAQKKADEKRFAAREGEDVAAALPVMLRDLASTAGRRLRKAGESYGYAESGEYIAEPSSYPEWVRRHPELSKAGRAAIERVAELGRTNGKMTERQIDLWTKLKQAASEEYSSNPEIQAGVDYERLRQQGFDFESQGALLASDFKENDSFAVVENGRPVKMTAKGVDENTGDFIFEKEDGGIVRRGAFDEIEPVATKFQKEAMPEGEIPFSKAKAPLENAADVRTELAELYSPRLAKLAEKNGLIKIVSGQEEAKIRELAVGRKSISSEKESKLNELSKKYERYLSDKSKTKKEIRLIVDEYARIAGVARDIPEPSISASMIEEVNSYMNFGDYDGAIDFLRKNGIKELDAYRAVPIDKLEYAKENGFSPTEWYGREEGVYFFLDPVDVRGGSPFLSMLVDDEISGGDVGVVHFKIPIEYLKYSKYDSFFSSSFNSYSPYSVNKKIEPSMIKGVYSASLKTPEEYEDNIYPSSIVRYKDGSIVPLNKRFFTNDTIEYKYSKDGRVEGFITKDGQVYLVQGNIAKGQTGGIVAHELGSHAMRSGFTKEQAWTDVLDHSDRLLAKGDKAVMEARRRAEEAGTPASLMREETVAYLSNIAPKHGIIRKLIAKLKQFMINKGLASKFFVSKLTAADLQSLAQGAAKAAIKGKAAPEWVKGVDARLSANITPDLRVEATNKKGESVTRPLSRRDLVAQEDLSPVKEAVEARTEELRTGLTEGDMLARKIEEAEQKKISPRRQAQIEKDLLQQVREFKKQHLQPEIQDMANEIFGAIDPEARRMTPAKEADLKATRAEIERLKAEGTDIDPALEAKVARLDRRRIGDMLPGEAQALLDVAKEIAYVNETKNKLLSVQRNRNAAEVSNGIVQAIKKKPSKRYLQAEQTGVKAERGKNPVLELGRNLIGDPASTFKTLMLDLGRANEKSDAVRMAQAVAERQNIELKHRKELDEQLARSIGKDWQWLAESKAWNAEQDVNGRKLTSGEKVYLKYSLNDQNVSDSIEKMGYRKKFDTKATKMSRAEREAIKLNPEEQKVYDALADYFESTYNILNPAHIIMKGWRLFKHEFGKYLPKSVSNLTLADELGSIIRSGSLDGTGVTIDRLGTLNEINLKDIFEIITRQRDIASKYAAYAPMVRDFNLVFRSPELRNTLQMEYGVEKNGKSIVENYVDDLLRDLQGNKQQSDSSAEAAVRKIRINTAGALLAFRFTTPLMQMTGYPRALAHISPQNLIKALRMRGGFEEAAKWNMRAYARQHIGIDRDIVDNRNKRLIRIGMSGIRKMDMMVTGRLWNATKLQVAQETGLKGDELLSETSKRFDAVLDTQGGHTMADLSMTSRTQNEIAKMFTIFSSDKFSMLNELKRGMIIRKHTGDWRPLARASAGLVLSSAMAASVATVVGGAVSGKDRDYEDEFMKNLMRNLPLFDQLASMFQGFNPSSAGIEAIGDAANAAGRIASLVKRQASGETVTAEQYSKTLQAVVNSASLAAGIPVENITDNLGFGKRLLLGKDPLEQVESELRRLEDFDFEKRKARVTRDKQGLELRTALSKLRAEFAGLDQKKVAAARRLSAARKRIKEIDKGLEVKIPAARRRRLEELREGIAEQAVR